MSNDKDRPPAQRRGISLRRHRAEQVPPAHSGPGTSTGGRPIVGGVLAAALALIIGVLAAGPAAAGPAQGLVGHRYSSTLVTGQQIPGGGPLQVAFPESGRISLTAGCNRFLGAVSVDGPSMRLGDLASTRMACQGPRGESDRWVTELAKAPLHWYSVGDALVLATPTSHVLLRRTR